MSLRSDQIHVQIHSTSACGLINTAPALTTDSWVVGDPVPAGCKIRQIAFAGADQTKILKMADQTKILQPADQTKMSARQ
jgi:hypothetical protein